MKGKTAVLICLLIAYVVLPAFALVKPAGSQPVAPPPGYSWASFIVLPRAVNVSFSTPLPYPDDQVLVNSTVEIDNGRIDVLFPEGGEYLVIFSATGYYDRLVWVHEPYWPAWFSANVELLPEIPQPVINVTETTNTTTVTETVYPPTQTETVTQTQTETQTSYVPTTVTETVTLTVTTTVHKTTTTKTTTVTETATVTTTKTVTHHH